MQENRNVFIAIALSLLVLLGWQFFILGPQEAERRERLEVQQAAEQARIEAQQTEGATQADPSAIPGDNRSGVVPNVSAGNDASAPGSTAPAATAATLEAALDNDPRAIIDTPVLSGSINLRGGRIDDILLREYRETIDPESPLIRLFHPVGSEGSYYAETGIVTSAGGPVLPKSDTLWSIEGNNTLSPDNPLTLVWENGEGLTFRRTYEIDDFYMFTITESVENATGEAITVFPYGFVSRRGRPSTSGIWILHEGLLGVFGEDGLQEVDYDDLEDDNRVEVTAPAKSWLGITDKYWAATLIPPRETGFKARFAFNPGVQPAYQADFLSDPITVAAGATGEATTLLFAGAKQTTLIDQYESQYEIDRFELLIDWGWFYFLTKPLFYALDWLYAVFGNFGVAILMVTVGIKIIFFWFANKSYISMSRMKLIQPRMKEIQERHKEDRQRMQQEMMKLYKEEKVNPLAGCWPVLIQIPVFFALYKVLFITIEMRHAPFFGWVQDLAAPDPTTLFNLFGLIPIDMPDWMPLIGIWPILMGITMFVQMKLNPAPPDPTQQMIFNWMPVIFTVMLAAFPAGLVIYWAWNNLLSVLQQYIIMRRQGVDVDIMGNILDTFRKDKKSSQMKSD